MKGIRSRIKNFIPSYCCIVDGGYNYSLLRGIINPIEFNDGIICLIKFNSHAIFGNVIPENAIIETPSKIKPFIGIIEYRVP